ncbi:MAG: AAA family ATPase, partial [Candidatus Gastranaerophilales bacterium]|nr:AAA family ATPase [Candidatus Gastranaerophilales bacterium]
MKTIAFALQKGGTGKTSTAVSVATELAKKHKVVLIDADPQGNASAWYNNELTAELSDVLTNKAGIGEALISTGIKNLFMIPTAG